MTKRLALTAVLFTWCLAASARAEPAPRSTDDEAAASALIEQAATAYDQNQLDEALRLLAQAYELSPRPSILYNRAQVLRTKDDCAAALDAYRRFIDSAAPDDANRDRAIRRRDEMQACVDRRAPPVPATVPEPPKLTLPASPPRITATETLTSKQPESPPAHRRAWRIGGWALVGAGVLAAGASAFFAWEAHRIRDDLDKDVSKNAMTWSTAFNTRYSEGQNDAARAWWCAGAAILSAGGGAALLMLAAPPSSAGQSTAQAHTPLLGWSGTF